MTDSVIDAQEWRWPDAEAVAVGYLSDALPTVVVATMVPDPRPAALVTVRRVGGPAGQVLDRPRLDVQVWALSWTDAATLAAQVRDLLRRMRGLIGGARVSRVAEVAGPAAVADPLSRTPRYVWAVELAVAASPAGD